MGGKQLGHRFAEGVAYGDYEQTMAKKRTRREKFLVEMEEVVPWKALTALIEPCYPKTSNEGGRPPYPLATMLRILSIAAVVQPQGSGDGRNTD